MDLPESGPSYPEFRLDEQQAVVLGNASERETDPVFICPTPVATARSAIKVSSVSPERWEMTARYPWRRARLMASRVSVTVPIWFSLMRMALAAPSDAFLQVIDIGNENITPPAAACSPIPG